MNTKKKSIFIHSAPYVFLPLNLCLLETYPRSLTKNKLVCFHSHIPSKSVMLFHNISKTGTTTTYKHLGVYMYAHMPVWMHLCAEKEEKRSGPLGKNGYMTSSSDGCGVSGISITVHLITLAFGLVPVQSVRCVMGSLPLFSSSAIV